MLTAMLLASAVPAMAGDNSRQERREERQEFHERFCEDCFAFDHDFEDCYDDGFDDENVELIAFGFVPFFFTI